MSGTITRTLILQDIECGECGVVFAMTEDYIAERRKDHRTWYCPNGHNRHYPAKSDVETARAERDRAQAETARVREQLAAEKKAHIAAKGAVTKLKNRAAAGMCPNCRRTFQNYARHMESGCGGETQ